MEYFQEARQRIEAEYIKNIEALEEEFNKVKQDVIKNPTGIVPSDYSISITDSKSPEYFFEVYRILSDIENGMNRFRGDYMGVVESISKLGFGSLYDKNGYYQRFLIGKINNKGKPVQMHNNVLSLNLETLIGAERSYFDHLYIEKVKTPYKFTIQIDVNEEVGFEEVYVIPESHSSVINFIFGKEEIMRRQKENLNIPSISESKLEKMFEKLKEK